MTRRVLVFMSCGLIGLLLVHTWLVQGVLAPVYVSGSSMAPTFRGPHCEVVCEQCESRFAVGVAQWPADGRVRCPACGMNSRKDAAATPERAGRRIGVDLTTYQFRRPRRWEVVVFRCPESASRLCIKRVVGLPDEMVRIQDGDVMVDGQLVRKSLADQRSLRQMVHRAGEGPSRWFPEKEHEKERRGWRRDGSRWTFSPLGRPSRTATGSEMKDSENRNGEIKDGENQDSEHQSAENDPASNESRIEWLTYRHLGDRPITDDMSYNQNVSRRLNSVRDVMLSCHVHFKDEPHGLLYLSATDGRDRFRIELDPAAAEVRLSRDGQVVCVEKNPLGSMAAQPAALLEFSLFDRQVLVAVDGQTVLAWPYEASEQSERPTARPVSIGASGLAVTLDALTLWRDVYYTEAGVRGAGDRRRLAADEYFVLGDNSPISRDSRYWRPAALRAKLLLGKPL